MHEIDAVEFFAVIQHRFDELVHFKDLKEKYRGIIDLENLRYPLLYGFILQEFKVGKYPRLTAVKHEWFFVGMLLENSLYCPIVRLAVLDFSSFFHKMNVGQTVLEMDVNAHHFGLVIVHPMENTVFA